MAELTEAARVRRLCDRLGFSLGGDALATAQEAGFEVTLQRLLQRRSPDRGAAATPAPVLKPIARPGQGKRKGQGTDGEDEREPVDPEAKKVWRRERNAQQQELTRWWLDRMGAADDQLGERLAWFWHGHFATSVQKVKSAPLMLQQNETLRKLGRGDFGTLARALVVDPAMLIWLDGNDNTVGAPNENLSREFMELFTLGHGAYGEDDVAQAARALTGWKINRRTGVAVLRQQQRDTHPKTILGKTADFDAAGFVDQVLTQPAAARFVAGRLWFRLVSDKPPTDAVMERLVAAYGAERDVTRLVGAIAAEPTFASDAATSLVKQPVEWVVGLLRALGVRVASLEDQQQRRLLAGLRGLGQVPFRPPSVGGWPAGAGWLTTAAALSRMDVARALTRHADLGAVPKASARNRPEQVRLLLGVDRFSVRTTTAIAQVGDQLPAAIAVGACSPEYLVSG